MGRRAQSNVRPALPVTPVVDGLEAGFGKVGNLIMDIACGGHFAAQDVILVAAELVRSFLVFPVFQPLRQHIVSFYGELVAGNVLRPQGDGLVNGGFPYGVREVGQAKDKVDAHVLETGFPHQPEGFAGPFRRVPAVHPAEQVVVQRLHAHAHAIDAQGFEAL